MTSMVPHSMHVINCGTGRSPERVHTRRSCRWTRLCATRDHSRQTARALAGQCLGAAALWACGAGVAAGVAACAGDRVMHAGRAPMIGPSRFAHAAIIYYREVAKLMKAIAELHVVCMRLRSVTPELLDVHNSVTACLSTACLQAPTLNLHGCCMRNKDIADFTLIKCRGCRPSAGQCSITFRKRLVSLPCDDVKDLQKGLNVHHLSLQPRTLVHWTHSLPIGTQVYGCLSATSFS